MGIGVGLLLIAAGAILVWGVNGNVGGVNEDAIGWILMIIGLVGLVLSAIFWSTWAGPGYWAPPRRLRRGSPAPRAGLLETGSFSVEFRRDGFGRPVFLF